MRRRHVYPHVMFRGRRGFGRFGWGWFWILSPLAILSFMFWPLGILLLIAIVIYALTRGKEEEKENKVTYVLPPSLPAQSAPVYGNVAPPTPLTNQTQMNDSNEKHFNYCPNCGSKLEGAYPFCPYCGYNLQQ